MGKCQLQMSLELSVLREAKLSHYLLVMHVLAANENRPHASTLFENRFHSTLSNACQVQPNSLVHCLFKLHLQDGQNTSCVRLRQRTIQETPHSHVFIFSLSLLYFKKKSVFIYVLFWVFMIIRFLIFPKGTGDNSFCCSVFNCRGLIYLVSSQRNILNLK